MSCLYSEVARFGRIMLKVKPVLRVVGRDAAQEILDTIVHQK